MYDFHQPIALLVSYVVFIGLLFLWHSRLLFGSQSSRPITKQVILAAALFGAFEVITLSFAIHYTSFFYSNLPVTLVGALTGLWIWGGFVLPALAIMAPPTPRPHHTLRLHGSFQLVLLILCGIILSVWR